MLRRLSILSMRFPLTETPRAGISVCTATIPRQYRCTTSRGDDAINTSLFSLTGIVGHILCFALSGHNLDIGSNAELFQELETESLRSLLLPMIMSPSRGIMWPLRFSVVWKEYPYGIMYKGFNVIIDPQRALKPDGPTHETSVSGPRFIAPSSFVQPQIVYLDVDCNTTLVGY